MRSLFFCIKKGGNSAFPFPVGSEQKGVLILFRWEISGDSEPLIPRKPTLYFAWKEVIQMAVFRIEKTRDYTVMSNHHLRDQSLSLKAKGLLSMMLSLPEEWNYTTRGLASICKEGTDSIGSALKELERTGYIVRNRLRDSKGKILDVEYVIYETPHPAAEPDTAAPDTACPHPENPDMDIPCLEKPSQLNIDRESNYPSKKDSKTIDQPNPILSNPPTPAGARMERDGMDVRETYREIILENIDYDILAEDPQIDREQLDEIVEIILDTVCTSRKTIRIASDDFPAEVVKSRFLKLNSSHIQYIMACMKENTTRIRNIKKYLLAALYNATFTIGSYYSALVQHDLSGDGQGRCV